MSNVAHTKVFYERIRSLRISDLRAYWKILNSDNHQKKRIVDATIHDFVAEHYEKLWNILRNFFTPLIMRLTHLYFEISFRQYLSKRSFQMY